MNNAYDAILFFDTLPPDEQARLRHAMEEDPALAETFAQWQHLRAALRQHLQARIPDRRLLVLYALAETEQYDVLTPAEAQALAEARPALEQALATHPGLQDVVRQIRQDAAAFEETWDVHVASPAPSPATERPPMPPRRARAGTRWVWRSTVAVTLMAFVAVLLLVRQRDQSLTTIETAAGEVRLVTLADSSVVRLLGSSTLSFPDAEQSALFKRRIRLEGRAYFDVQPDREGFTVETPTALTTVLGTQFGVQATSAATEVVLATGRVALAPKAAQAHIVVLEEGQASRVAAGALPSTPAPVSNLTEALDWTGLFVFNQTSLDAAAIYLSEHYDIPVTIAPSLQAERIYGKFEQEQPLADILHTLATTLGATVESNPTGGFTLAPAAHD